MFEIFPSTMMVQINVTDQRVHPTSTADNQLGWHRGAVKEISAYCIAVPNGEQAAFPGKPGPVQWFTDKGCYKVKITSHHG